MGERKQGGERRGGGGGKEGQKNQVGERENEEETMETAM